MIKNKTNKEFDIAKKIGRMSREERLKGRKPSKVWGGKASPKEERRNERLRLKRVIKERNFDE